MEYKKTRFVIEDGVGIISLDSQETLNAFDGEMNPELLARLNEAEDDDNVKVVVIESLQKAFSAGGNLKVFYNKYKEDGEVELDILVVQAARIASAIKKMTKLVITSVNGGAAGAGAGLALSGDYIFAAENAKITQAFVNVGLATDTGGAYLLAKSLGYHRALDLCISGRPLKAEEAKQLGVVHEIVPLEDLHDKTLEFAKKLATGPIKAYANIKRQLYFASLKDYDSYLQSVETPLQCASMKTKDFVSAICAFSEKKEVTFIGK